MLSPEEDVADRSVIWDVMQDLYMDTDVTISYKRIARTCAASKYTLNDLNKILFNVVLPALKFNMFDLPAPEWMGFEREWLVERVLKKHRFGKRKPWVLRFYTALHWRKIKPMIIKARYTG